MAVKLTILEQNKVHQGFVPLCFILSLFSVRILFLSDNKENWAKSLFIRLLNCWCGNLHNDCTQMDQSLQTRTNCYKLEFNICDYGTSRVLSLLFSSVVLWFVFSIKSNDALKQKIFFNAMKMGHNFVNPLTFYFSLKLHRYLATSSAN